MRIATEAQTVVSRPTRDNADVFGLILGILRTVDAALSIRGVSVAYDSSLAVDDVSFDAPAGCSVAVIGPNGSGKSTLLKAIAGLETPQSGAVEIRDGGVSVVLQATDVDPSVPITARSVISMARYPSVGLFRRFGAADRAAIDQAMSRLRLDDLADRQIHHLSGGQRQRVFVAQGLAQDAAVLLLDEPITGLDVTSQHIIAEALEDERAAGKTVVTTTHSFDEADRSDLVLLLATRCVAFGPPAEVLTEAHLQEAFGGRFVRVGNTLVLDDPHHHDPHDHAHGPHHGHQH